MTFARASKYHQVSDCGQYTVCWISGKYEAWHLREQLDVNLETAEAARESCRLKAMAAARKAAVDVE